MNGLVFLLPFVFVAGLGIYQDSFALETVTGYNYFDITNPDGSHTWRTHYPYILHNGNYVPFIYSNGNKVETGHGSIIQNADGSYSFYKNGIINEAPLFTDKIIAKYADVSNLNNWTYLNSLNNDTPDNSWDGSQFVSSKINGVGKLDYKYINNNGKWKTQLEATNLSGLTTKAFGFDQIIDLESDTIKFGGITRNLDSFNNTTFDKQFLINNKGKVIDFLNDFNFDFDLGFDNLYSITVYDTGINKSRFVFDYRTSVPLLPNDTLIIDPTFGYTAASTETRIISNAAAGAACPTASYSVYVGNEFVFVGNNGAGGQCERMVLEWNTSTIPDYADPVSVNLKFDVTATPYTVRNCDFNAMDVARPSTSGSPGDLYADAGNGTTYVNNDSTCTTIANDKVISLGSTAATDLKNKLSADWFGLGVKLDNEARDGSDYGQSEGGGLWELEVTYFIPNPWIISDLSNSTTPTATTIGLNWTAPYAGSASQQIIGYMINVTTPQTNTPLVFVNDTGNTYTNYNVTGLTFGSDYSASVLAWGNNTSGHPLYNSTLGNIFNFTTATETYSPGPTNFLMLPNGTSTSILNMNWTAPLMNNINGYRIQCEAPVGGGFSTTVSNTTTLGTTYNRTGLSVNTYYNCKVAGLNGSGITDYSNTYSQTTFHLPDAVDDLVATPTDIIDIILTFTQPDTLYGYLTGYNINYSTPQSSDPLTVYVASTGSSDVSYTLTGLAAGDAYSFRVSAITIHGKNVTGALVANATSFSEFEIGSLDLPTGTNPVQTPIQFVEYPLNSSASDLQVRYDSSYALACDFAYMFGDNNQTYTGLTETAISGSSVYSNFTLLNLNNDIIDVYCWDTLDTTTNGRERLGGSNGTVPLFDQISSFQSGAFGTTGKFGALDLMTLIIVIVSMIGFNRDHPEVGVAIMGTMMGVCYFYGIIQWETGLTGAVILVVALAIANSKRGSSN